MSDPRSVADRVADLDLVDRMLDRIATDDEAAAARRVFGVDAEADRLNAAFAPDLPPFPVVGEGIDHLAHARAAVARYAAWADSHPDDDPTPMRERERTLRLARLDLERLENQ